MLQVVIPFLSLITANCNLCASSTALLSHRMQLFSLPLFRYRTLAIHNNPDQTFTVQSSLSFGRRTSSFRSVGPHQKVFSAAHVRSRCPFPRRPVSQLCAPKTGPDSFVSYRESVLISNTHTHASTDTFSHPHTHPLKGSWQRPQRLNHQQTVCG